MTKSKAGTVIVLVLVLVAVLATADFVRVSSLGIKPLFCIPTVSADDGGSGRYVGAGYGFHLQGHLIIDSGWVCDSFIFYILGIPIKTVEILHCG